MMKYEREILTVLHEAGQKGLSVRKIARHVYNSCNGLFSNLTFEEVTRHVKVFLHKNSRQPNAMLERTGVRGIYRLSKRYEKNRQLMFDFQCEDKDSSEEEETDVDEKETMQDTSLSLFEEDFFNLPT